MIDLIAMDYGSMELREIASDLAVTRERGATKRETAAAIAYQASDRIKVVEDGAAKRVVFRR